MTGKKSSNAQKIKDFLAGTVGGVAQVFSGQPFDIVKVRLQSQSKTNPQYKNMVDCAKQILAKEGVTGFYKGTLPPLMGVSACVSIQFSVMEGMKRFLHNMHQSNLTTRDFFISGAAAGIANATVSIPVEHLRIRMQVQSGPVVAYTSSVDAFKKIYAEFGLRGLYKGAVPALYRESIGYGFYFGMYEVISRAMMKPGETSADLSVAKLLLAGGLGGTCMWAVTFPFDTMKTRLQTDAFKNGQYNGIKDCARKILTHEGVAGFFPGFAVCMLRSVPVNAATFAAFELAIRVLGRDETV
mmetsp:Transcript_2687/g.2833  ORF Transcript_2687/g.2833 Transcript_2687/m.2833 type:complete len:298 (+) Transcript_2687:58-951(+)|eukprot:CAMPEP_0115010548 /NCGR_PEP_ID=MMETSP0216-20121206/23386_1 /TAXON_ID=223996 /ORGANISM="Protocruzia adherens, Strain Boccale" /LENGTH=297 /DNA_ID=CAMNT_0002378793 /DNA_START=40 /DNA_END=933 /DNA_ORIENTATION=-